jgi:hypothetical protein
MKNFTLTTLLTIAITTFVVLSTAKANEHSVASVPATTTRSTWGGFLEYDLGVLAMSGGVGLFGGPTYGPLRAGLGFYRFDSPYRALSGAPKGFELKVNYIISADVSWHFLHRAIRGPYVRVMSHLKQQQVENRDNGVRRKLDSLLIGPEIGWTFLVYRGLYLAPRLGALYYVKSPQGSDGAPVDVGGKLYDNDNHTVFDLFATAGIGYAF